MSLILGIVFTNRAIVISDGRVKNASTGLVIDEKFDKTRKINDNVILGFSGDREFSIWLLELFENVCKQDCDLLEYLSQRAVISEVFCDGVG